MKKTTILLIAIIFIFVGGFFTRKYRHSNIPFATSTTKINNFYSLENQKVIDFLKDINNRCHFAKEFNPVVDQEESHDDVINDMVVVIKTYYKIEDAENGTTKCDMDKEWELINETDSLCGSGYYFYSQKRNILCKIGYITPDLIPCMGGDDTEECQQAPHSYRNIRCGIVTKGIQP